MNEKDFQKYYEEYIESTAFDLGAEIKRFLRDNDELIAVTLEAHLYIEEQMIELLAKVMDKDSVKKFSFDNKLKILNGMGLLTKITYTSINYFNEIRNDLSHQPGFKVDEKRINNFIEKMLKESDEELSLVIKNHAKKEIEFNERYRRAISLVSCFLHIDSMEFYKNFFNKSQQLLTDERQFLEAFIEQYKQLED